MKYGLAGLFLLFSLATVAQQTIKEQFEKIKTIADAEKFVAANPNLKPAIRKVVYGKDSSRIDQRLLKLNKGDILPVAYVTYKVVDASESVKYRASYVFLDGGELTKVQIDSLKNLIVKKANEGTPFEKLSDDYSMDGNSTHGDTGWFFGEDMVPKELQDGVKAHKKGEIFFVEVPERNWYYIVKKTYDDDLQKEMTVLQANGR